MLAGGAGTFRMQLGAPGGGSLFDAAFVDRRDTLPETGTYTLRVRGTTETTVGIYSFRLLLVPPAEHSPSPSVTRCTEGCRVLANDSDPDGDDLLVEAVSEPGHGQATTAGDPRVGYEALARTVERWRHELSVGQHPIEPPGPGLGL